jgi:signal transduction histidine kinase
VLGLGSLTLRLVAGATVWIAAALLAGGLILSALFKDRVEQSFDERLGVLLETLVAVTDSGPAGTVRLLGPQGEPRFDQPFSGWYWQINGGAKPVLRSRSLWDQVLELPVAASARPGAEGSAIRRYRIPGPRGQMLQVVERNITFSETGPTFRYAVATNRATIRAAQRPFKFTLGWSLGILGMGLIIGVVIQVWFGLRPLRRLRQSLAHVRAGGADRIEGRFPTEVRPLVDDANALIAHIGQVVDRARTHVGNLAHALKTPLSVLANEAEEAQGPLAENVRRETALMRSRIDHHLARARTAATGGIVIARAELAPVVDGLARALAKMYTDKGLDVGGENLGGFAFRGDPQDLEEMLGNLMENACKWAVHRVRVTAATVPGGQIQIAIEDDGPGLPPEDRDRVLARGARLDESVPGSGLGLAIVSEIATLYGGSIHLDTSGLGGLRAELTLPGTGAGT